MEAPVSIELAAAKALRASAGVSAICGGRVYPLKIPQGSMLPAVIYQRVYSGPDYTLAGYSSESVTLMLNSFAMKYEQAKELALAVRYALAVGPVNAVFDSDQDLLNANGDVFCVSARFICQQSGGYCHG